MTPKQAEYVRHRASGLGQKQAAIAAGYSPRSAKVSASRMERNPAIRQAIVEARQAGTPALYEDAESFLAAVVQGATPADPVRVGAARTLIQYQRRRERSPLKGPTPRELARRDAQAAEQELLDAWAAKATAIRERLERKRKS